MSVGTRPADVCGWATYPNSSRSDMIVRMVAGLSENPYLREMVRDPTGSAVRM